jgi:uncharacterized protein YqeY
MIFVFQNAPEPGPMLRQRLGDELKVAMKAREQHKVSTLRLILAALKDRDIAVRTSGRSDGIDNDEILGLLAKMVSQRRESIRLYEDGGRVDLAEREAEEIVIIEAFLPQQLNDGEVGEAIAEAIAEVGAKGLKDMGPTMAALKARYMGRMDFSKAGAAVKARLV